MSKTSAHPNTISTGANSASLTNPFASADSGANAPKKTGPRGDFAHLRAMLAEIDDPEERARFRREWGLLGLDEDGRPGPSPSDGNGPESSFNAAVAPRSPEEYWGDDRKALQAECDATAEVERRRKYLSLDDAREIIEAASFMVQLRGNFVNSQITLVWNLLGTDTDECATQLFSDFTRELNMRFRAWGYPLDYVYVHERSGERGFHTHMIAHIPAFLRARVVEWTKGFFARRSNAAVHPEAVLVQISGRRGAPGQMELHQHRVLYLCKGLDPEALDRDARGKLKPVDELIGVPEVRRRVAGEVWCAQRRGCSHSLSPAARKAGYPARSAVREKDWRGLWSGWELDEHRKRLEEAEQERLRSVIARLQL